LRRNQPRRNSIICFSFVIARTKHMSRRLRAIRRSDVAGGPERAMQNTPRVISGKEIARASALAFRVSPTQGRMRDTTKKKCA
jgi:hypothetical protein